MPDVLEMPYRPEILNAGMPNEKEHTYRIGSGTCLSGDVIGDYSFDKELKIDDKIAILDMAIYTMVKSTTFNGKKLPDIYYVRKKGKVEKVREFGYEDFVARI